ncbi:hypothetical protein OG539_26765 [Actinacidiphila glaucinigra]|uniref:hypothetical protein n=1 Tax=Actinacidiphila glaucinigra TaxID=235986 RepID=UPI002DDC3FD5|nr:hypothetical protein [Actinacidiphila glaucinigra]WSD60338.1 hypothetical protein OIE69_16140 [Actinacidiphila glaucinigra]
MKIRSALALAALAGSLLAAVPAGSAGAAEPICNPGKHRFTWTDVSKQWVVTHKAQIENYTGGTASRTYTAKKITKVAASVKATVGAKVGANIAIASIEEHVDLELQLSGEHTRESSVSVSYKFTKDGDYIIYSGTRKVSGYYTYWRCDRGTKWVKTGQYGKTQSWTLEVDGGVRCTAKPGKSTLAYAVKKKYCRS